jgi:hypothetical protein
MLKYTSKYHKIPAQVITKFSFFIMDDWKKLRFQMGCVGMNQRTNFSQIKVIKNTVCLILDGI